MTTEAQLQHMRERITAGHCPDCGYRGFVIGPMADAQRVRTINIECGNLSCRSRFNVAFWSGNAVFAQPLPHGSTSAFWPSEPIPGERRD